MKSLMFDLLSEEMIEPRCVHFGSCGGCSYQHIPYETQLQQKESLVKKLFDFDVDPIIPCEEQWHYRNKMEFSFGRWDLGLMKRGKRGHVISLEECWLTSPWFTETLKQVREWWKYCGLEQYHPPSDRGTLRTLTLREGCNTGEKMVVLTVSGDPEIEDFVEADSVILRKQRTAKKQPTYFEETVLCGKDHIFESLADADGREWQFKLHAASFFQPNSYQAQRLYQKVVEIAEIQDEIVFDLYCGAGTIGMFASKYAKKVYGIEIVSDAVRGGIVNLELNEVRNMKILEGDAADALNLIEDFPTTVIIDPPRAGLTKKAIKNLIALNPEKIVYISCNPVTQSDNCKDLNEAGYELRLLQPIDQFPHTPHIENIAFLTKI